MSSLGWCLGVGLFRDGVGDESVDTPLEFPPSRNLAASVHLRLRLWFRYSCSCDFGIKGLGFVELLLFWTGLGALGVIGNFSFCGEKLSRRNPTT